MKIKIGEFDLFNRLEAPTLILQELSHESLGVILYINATLDLYKYDISTLKLQVPKKFLQNDKLVDYVLYNDIKELRLIYVKDLGYFQLNNVNEINDGFKEYKDCEAFSVQCSFQVKRINNIVGEFKLYDPLVPAKSLIDILLTQNPSWSLGIVDSVFLTRQRSLNITESDLYSMFTSNFYEDFEALFYFDYLNYKIHIEDAQKTFRNSEIFIDDYNLLKKYEILSETEKIVTKLTVIGADGIDISAVNPSGNNEIYNLNAFKDRMSPDLVIALNNYESKHSSLKQQYSSLLLQQKNTNINLNSLKSNTPEYKTNYQKNQDMTLVTTPNLNNNSGLSQFEALEKALLNVRSVRIQNENVPYKDVNNMLLTVSTFIKNKKKDIINAENALKTLKEQISSINNQLNMQNNFTKEQWRELNEYFRSANTLQNNAFAITDVMTEDEKLAKYQELLKHGELVLNKSAYPTYMFKISSVNFLALPEFKYFQDEFELGTYFTLKVNANYTIKPMLLGVRIDFTDYSNFELIFGNRTNVNDGFDFSGYRNAVSFGTSLSFDQVKIEALKNSQDDVANFINGSLIAATNEIKSTENYSDVVINERGVLLNQYDSSTKVELPYKAMLTGSIFAFSDDYFQTSKMALGRIKNPGINGGYSYGLVGDILIGRIIAGNNLHISNANNNFTLNEQGAFLNNASLTINKSQNGVLSEIILNPSVGISISKNNVKQLFIDTNGNISLSGGATISWQNVNPPNASEVGARPDDWFPNASEVGAIPDVANAITTTHISAEAITTPKIATNSISSDRIQAGAIISSKIAAGSVTSDKITVNNLSSIKSDLGSITGGSININNKFIVGSDGSTTIGNGGNSISYSTTTGLMKLGDSVSISWSNVAGKPTDLATQSTIDKIVNGTYTGGSFISGEFIYSPKISGGTIDIGTGNFAVNDEGNVTIKKGGINLGTGNFIVDNEGNVTMKKGSMNIADQFAVDKYGNVTIKNGVIKMSGIGSSIDINNKFKVNPNGEMTAASASITGGSININNNRAKIDSDGSAVFESVTIRNQSKLELGNYDYGYYGTKVGSDGILRAKGAEIDGDGTFRGTIYAKNIVAGNGEGDTTGTISAALLKVDRIQSLQNSKNYLTVGNNYYADLTWYSQDRTMIQFQQRGIRDVAMTGGNIPILYTNSDYGTVNAESMWVFGGGRTSFVGDGTYFTGNFVQFFHGVSIVFDLGTDVEFDGNVDFTNANVSGLSSIAVFG